jgi:hypothetical protein
LSLLTILRGDRRRAATQCQGAHRLPSGKD